METSFKSLSVSPAVAASHAKGMVSTKVFHVPIGTTVMKRKCNHCSQEITHATSAAHCGCSCAGRRISKRFKHPAADRAGLLTGRVARGWEGREVASGCGEDALAERGQTRKKQMQRKLGVLLCLEHLLATDCILSSKELFIYSRHFRPLYSQLRLFKYSLGDRYMALCFNCFSNICKEIVYLLSRCYASPPLLVPIGYY